MGTVGMTTGAAEQNRADLAHLPGRPFFSTKGGDAVAIRGVRRITLVILTLTILKYQSVFKGGVGG